MRIVIPLLGGIILVVLLILTIVHIVSAEIQARKQRTRQEPVASQSRKEANTMLKLSESTILELHSLRQRLSDAQKSAGLITILSHSQLEVIKALDEVFATIDPAPSDTARTGKTQPSMCGDQTTFALNVLERLAPYITPALQAGTIEHLPITLVIPWVRALDVVAAALPRSSTEDAQS